jgi:hypothetical protein
MPVNQKPEKFYVMDRKGERGGTRKGVRFLASPFKKRGHATLQELFDFLKKNKINPAKVKVPPGFFASILP